MSSDPKITMAVYIGGAVIFVLVLLYMFFYTRGLNLKKAAQREMGRPPVTETEGIAIATEEKEREGRTGTIN